MNSVQFLFFTPQKLKIETSINHLVTNLFAKKIDSGSPEHFWEEVFESVENGPDETWWYFGCWLLFVHPVIILRAHTIFGPDVWNI